MSGLPSSEHTFDNRERVFYRRIQSDCLVRGGASDLGIAAREAARVICHLRQRVL